MTGIACTYRPQIYIYIDIVNHRIRTSSMRISTNGNVKFSLECLSLGIVDIPTL